MSKKWVSTGFTLIEMLVAIGISAWIALLAWRSIDMLIRTRQSADDTADHIHLLQAGLAQWKTDLNHMVSMPGISPWSWDGRTLRISRQPPAGAQGIVVVAWRLNSDAGVSDTKVWERWQSHSVRTSAQWQRVWQEALRTRTVADRAFAEEHKTFTLFAVTDWQLWSYANGAWALAMDRANGSTREQVGDMVAPEGLRVVLLHPPGSVLAGSVSMDWINPAASGFGL